MTDHRYPWRRYWLPRDAAAPTDRDGFLRDPASGPSWYDGAPPVHDLAELAETPCLVLLGEPGMGKSTVLADERARMERAGETTAFINLNGIENGEELDQELRHHLTAERLRHRVILFLDSLDEAMLRVQTIGDRLVKILDRQAKDACTAGRLHLRLACRAAEWPSGLTKRLKGVFGKDTVSERVLAPLSRADVILATTMENLDGESFAAELVARQAVSLATRPVTLTMLLGRRIQGAPLPHRRAELYEQACLAMCEETDEVRRERHDGRLDAKRRLALARRIAALAMFCQRRIIDTGPAAAAPPDALALAEIVGQPELVDDREFPVSESDVREVLTDTALFCSPGTGRFWFAHQTYAEFLAASYLIHRALSPERILSLIRHPDEPGCAVPPQLAETAAWLGSWDAGLFRTLTKDNPEIMLRSDVATATSEDRELLVESYLAACAGGQAHDGERDRHRLYSRLAHPRLADQLRPWIGDKSAAWIARRAAFEIAEANKLSDLSADLLTAALDQEETTEIRVQAVLALESVADMDVCRALVPLALGRAGPDSEDELRGVALRTVWPAVLDTSTMLDSLHPQKRDDLSGKYNWFLNDTLLKRLPSSDLPIALQWMARFVERHPTLDIRRMWPFENLARDLVVAGMRRYRESDILEGTATLVLTLQPQHAWYRWSGELRKAEPPVLTDRAACRALVEEMSLRITPGGVYHLLYDPPLLWRDDLPWALEKIRASTQLREQTLWADIANRLWAGDIESFAVIYDLAQTVLAVRDEFKLWLEGIPLDSKTAESAREAWTWQNRSQLPHTPLTCDLVQKLAGQHLNAFDGGHLDSWWMLGRLLEQIPEGSDASHTTEHDLEQYPGYACLTPEQIERVRQAARVYVRNGHPGIYDEDTWWNQINVVDWRAIFGVLALNLLHRRDPAFLDALPTERWTVWAPAIVAFSWRKEASEDGRWPVFDRCVVNAHGAVLDALRHRIDLHLANGDENLDLKILLGVHWDAACAALVIDAARDPRTRPYPLRTALALLLEHGAPEGEAMVAEAARTPPDADEAARKSAAAVLATAFLIDAPARWPLIQSLMNSQTALAKAVFVALHGRSPALTGGDGDTFALLTPSAWGEIFAFLHRHFLQEKRSGAYRAGPVDHVVDFRYGILNRLISSGTPESVAALEQLAADLPELVDDLRWRLVDARRIARQKTWTTPRPADVLSMIASPTARLLRSPTELLDLIVESLERLNDRLQSKTPLARTLWNEPKGSTGKPKPGTWWTKDENFLSDYVKQHLVHDLDRRGVIANREVEIRASGSASQGERTDIQVDAVLHQPGRSDPHSVISVIVEVKGCWHDELMTAMETQLRDRYLENGGFSHGLYLVGWFVCDCWADPKIAARKPKPGFDLTEARAHFSKQAQNLSTAKRTLRAFVLDAAVR